MSTPLLKVSGLKVTYGHIEAVKGIDFELHEGQITTLVGANGAGKSTTLLALSGLVKKAAGQVLFNGQDLTNLAPHRIVSSGVVQVAEGRATLTTLTVRENLELGAYTRKDRGNRAQDLDYVYSLFPRLKERADGLAGNLSGGEQQMLAIGRALMVNPILLLLDEPMEGLAPIIVQELQNVIRRLIDEGGMAVIVVEQHARLALGMTRRAMVLDRGKVVHASTSTELLADKVTLDRLLTVA